MMLEELGRLNTRVAHDGELMCFLSLARFLSSPGQFECFVSLTSDDWFRGEGETLLKRHSGSSLLKVGPNHFTFVAGGQFRSVFGLSFRLKRK